MNAAEKLFRQLYNTGTQHEADRPGTSDPLHARKLLFCHEK